MEAKFIEIYDKADKEPATAFYAFRLIYMPPVLIVNALDKCKKMYPDAKVKVVDAYNYFRLMKDMDAGK